ncbi:hypothetical protein BpHYR1_022190 [Brachionus plicatilis]|uniref:Uncharacterized protein n=1 Tax=Brachionus plicatilis TaxID=10195 RepID=A0A3M7RKG7_BRAPC|nr:hypothetical protein BpHYR1_022190 [Brachionus plicatilis]
MKDFELIKDFDLSDDSDIRITKFPLVSTILKLLNVNYWADWIDLSKALFHQTITEESLLDISSQSYLDESYLELNSLELAHAKNA